MIYQVEFRFNDTKSAHALQKDSTHKAQYVSNLSPIDVWEEHNAIVIHRIIPANISSQNAYNDYSPRIYPKQSQDYTRVIKRVSEYSEALER